MAFFNAFRRFPHQFIWRFEGKLDEAKNTNVYVSKWLPQRDLLNHKNAAAFITHGGYNSIMEAVVGGVPLIATPLFADQYANAAKVERAGIGLSADLKSLNEGDIYNALQSLLTNQSYTQSAQRLSNMIAKQPVSGRESAIKWTEFLAEFGHLDNLQPGSKYLYLYQYFLLDVLVIVLLVASLFIYCCYRSCKLCLRVCRRGAKTKKE